ASALEAATEENTKLNGDVEVLQSSLANQFEEGFDLALAQMRIVFPELDAERLKEVDATHQIMDGKVVPYAPPGEQ
ncbi:hypothetical protein A2U01_0086178, partial [Trifolium medium]|nr:hypothetical protein [Trifolium medium]